MHEVVLTDVRTGGRGGPPAGVWTDTFAAAMNELSAAGGGTLRVPAGEYITGTIHLPSHVTLYLEENARIVGSPRIEDYTTGAAGHNPDRTPWHLIVAERACDVAIEGRGTVDGSGTAFWERDPHRPDYEGGFVSAHKDRRPSPMVEITGCRDVRIMGVTLTHAPGWTLHLHDCDDIVVRGVRIENSPWGPNTDGIDMTGVHNALVEDCTIHTGDDAVCLKTTGDSRDVRNVIVRRCDIRTYCVGLKLGCVESVRDMRGILFEDCRVRESSRMVAIYSYRGARIEGVTVRRVSGDTRAPLILNRPIHIEGRLDRPDSSQPDPFVHDPARRPPRIHDVLIEEFACRTDGRIMVVASDGVEVGAIVMRNVTMDYPVVYNASLTGAEAASRQCAVGAPEARNALAAVVVDGPSRLTIDGLDIEWPRDPEVPVPWQFPLRYENGSTRAFPATENDRAERMGRIWARRGAVVTVRRGDGPGYGGGEAVDVDEESRIE